MTRAVASAGAVVTQRIVFPILGIAFGIRSEGAFWLGFVAAFALGWAVNLALAEVWLRWKPSRSTIENLNGVKHRVPGTAAPLN
jgi:hypothetical protein